MAKSELRRAENVAGDFFVDESCIDCDTCRWMAPSIFDRAAGQARVHHQPTMEEERDAAVLALVSCPTASIGSTEQHPVSEIAEQLPLQVAENVFHCGYHDKSSFGAASYLIVRPEGNVLVDSPRFAKPLVRRLEELGGVQTLFLTHRDDVGDHHRFHDHFGCDRILHRADAHNPALAAIENLIDGEDPVSFDDDLLMIPVPGHTAGSACLLYNDSFLFTGDHLAWSPTLNHLYAFRSACWFDWDVQVESMRRLAAHKFDWVLPGHGRRKKVGRAASKQAVLDCVDWMVG